MNPWDWTESQGNLWTRDHPHPPDSGFGGGGQEFAFNANGTSQTAIINQFKFQAARSIRTSTIILAVFNVVAASATILGISWDSYVTKKREDPKFKFRYVRNHDPISPFHTAAEDGGKQFGNESLLTMGQVIGVFLRRPGRDLPLRLVYRHCNSRNYLRRCSVDWPRLVLSDRVCPLIANDATWYVFSNKISGYKSCALHDSYTDGVLGKPSSLFPSSNSSSASR